MSIDPPSEDAGQSPDDAPATEPPDRELTKGLDEESVESPSNAIHIDELRDAARKTDLGPGSDMTPSEIKAALADASNPRHDDAVTTNKRVSEQMVPLIQSLTGSLMPGFGLDLGKKMGLGLGKKMGLDLGAQISGLGSLAGSKEEAPGHHIVRSASLWPSGVPEIDLTNTPIVRTARFSEQTVEMLGAIAATLLEQNEAAKRSNAEASKTARKTLWVAVFTLLATVVGLLIAILVAVHPWG